MQDHFFWGGDNLFSFFSEKNKERLPRMAVGYPPTAVSCRSSAIQLCAQILSRRRDGPGCVFVTVKVARGCRRATAGASAVHRGVPMPIGGGFVGSCTAAVLQRPPPVAHRAQVQPLQFQSLGGTALAAPASSVLTPTGGGPAFRGKKRGRPPKVRRAPEDGDSDEGAKRPRGPGAAGAPAPKAPEAEEEPEEPEEEEGDEDDDDASATFGAPHADTAVRHGRWALRERRADGGVKATEHWRDPHSIIALQVPPPPPLSVPPVSGGFGALEAVARRGAPAERVKDRTSAIVRWQDMREGVGRGGRSEGVEGGGGGQHTNHWAP